MAARFPADRCQLCGVPVMPGQPVIVVRIAKVPQLDEASGQMEIPTDRAFPLSEAVQHQSPYECGVLMKLLAGGGVF